MKRRLLSVLVILLVIASSLPTLVSAMADTETEVELAQSVGQAFIDELAETDSDFLGWKDARLEASQPYCDLEGRVIAYMFAIQKGDKPVGHVVVGGASYDYPIFEAGKDPPPSVPSADKVKSSLEKDLGLKIDEGSIPKPSHLVYLGLGGFYAIYDIEGQMVGVNLITARAVLASNMKSSIPSPQEYKAGMKEIEESKPESLGRSVREKLEAMVVWNDCNDPLCWCGPCTGVSIGDYYRDRTDRQNYGDLYDNEYMYDRLYDSMEADFHGGAVMPWDFGPGFVEMTEECGYENPTIFDSEHDGFVTPGDYWNTVDDIDHGWPLGLLCTGELHWRGIKGYRYDDNNKIIICTDIHYAYDKLYGWPWGPGIDTVRIFPTWAMWDCPIAYTSWISPYPSQGRPHLSESASLYEVDYGDADWFQVYWWDQSTQEWKYFDSFLPPGNNTLHTLEPDEYYQVVVSDPCKLKIPQPQGFAF
ncbi:MAG: hypothetical protein SU899_03125 [Chloroflexota bacterium]|nr:hypothetical protein [Chloroflexota bacterium]